jgi:hypothetical protein
MKSDTPDSGRNFAGVGKTQFAKICNKSSRRLLFNRSPGAPAHSLLFLFLGSYNETRTFELSIHRFSEGDSIFAFGYNFAFLKYNFMAKAMLWIGQLAKPPTCVRQEPRGLMGKEMLWSIVITDQSTTMLLQTKVATHCASRRL